MESKFLKIKCPRCARTQVIFGKASTRVKCQGCKLLLAETRGGKARIKAAVEKIL